MNKARFQTIRNVQAYIAQHASQCDGEREEHSHPCFACGNRVWGYASRCAPCTEKARPLFSQASDLRMREVMGVML
jgi:hypothetical protein